MTKTFQICSYSMHVQRVHCEVVRVHAEVVEDLLECNLLAALLQHHTFFLCLVCGLDKFQQMLLVHASSSMYMCVHLYLTQSKTVTMCVTLLDELQYIHKLKFIYTEVNKT